MVAVATAARTSTAETTKAAKWCLGRTGRSRRRNRGMWCCGAGSGASAATRAQQSEFLGLDDCLELRADAELGVQRLHVAATGLEGDAQHAGDGLDLHAAAEAVQHLLLAAGEL